MSATHRGFSCVLLILCFALLSGGCSEEMSKQLAGQWAQFSEDRGMVSAAKPGMSMGDVLNKVGEPKQMISGEMAYSGWKQWVYPSGSIFFYRGKVRTVHAKPLTSKQLADLKESQDDYLSVKKMGEDASGKTVDDSINEDARDQRWVLPEDNTPGKRRDSGIIDTGK